jgi:hypothetical protein
MQVALAGLLFSIAFSAGCRNKTTLPESSASQRCASCHLAEFESVKRPPHAGVRPTTCATCHLDTSWKPYRLAHAWPLQGAHAKAACFGCHRGEPRQFEGTDPACVACHRADDDKANRELTWHAKFPTICATCHTTVAWKPTLPHDSAPAETAVTNQAPASSGNGASSASPGSSGAPAASGNAKKTPKRPPVVRRKPDAVTTASPVWKG